MSRGTATDKQDSIADINSASHPCEHKGESEAGLLWIPEEIKPRYMQR
jgi:hypothetical protein